MVFFNEMEYKTEAVFPQQDISHAKGLRESGPRGCSINLQGRAVGAQKWTTACMAQQIVRLSQSCTATEMLRLV